MRTLAVGLVSMIAFPCAAAPGMPLSGETITYHHESGGLCLPDNTSEGCADYLIVVHSDGRGTFEQKRAPDPGPIAFSTSRSQAMAFRRALGRYRAKGERLLDNMPPCRSFVTEGETIDVRWQPRHGAGSRLRYNAGCGFPGSRQMFTVLIGAPRLLPIADRLPAR